MEAESALEVLEAWEVQGTAARVCCKRNRRF
jgi:hypothetical protein